MSLLNTIDYFQVDFVSVAVVVVVCFFFSETWQKKGSIEFEHSRKKEKSCKYTE